LWLRAQARYHPRRLATAESFRSLDVRVGTVVSARQLRGARQPTHALTIHFGSLGEKRGAARIGDLYDAEDLVGLQVVAVVNLPGQQVAGFDSEVLVLSVDDGRGNGVLLIPERPVPDGGRIA
jgi:tRNA-binding protein